MARPRKPRDLASPDRERPPAGSLRAEIDAEMPPDAVPEAPARRRRARGEDPAPALAPPAAHWAELGPVAKAMMQPLYVALEAELPPDDVFKECCGAWGRVVDYYVPAWANRPEGPAIAATCALAGPLVIAWQRKRHAAATPAPAAAAVAGDGKVVTLEKRD